MRDSTPVGLRVVPVEQWWCLGTGGRLLQGGYERLFIDRTKRPRIRHESGVLLRISELQFWHLDGEFEESDANQD